MPTPSFRRQMSFLSSVRVAGLSMLAASVFALGPIAAIAQDADVNAKSSDTPPPVAKPLDKATAPESPEFLPQLSPHEQKILSVLSESAEVTFVESPLYEAVQVLKDLHGIEIWVDKESLTLEGISTDRPINLALSGVTLRSTFRLLLEPLALTHVIEDEVLKITTQKVADKTLVTRTYPVGDLFDTREEADELLESLHCGLGLAHQGKDAPKSLAVSVPSGAIIARLSRPQNDQLLQLIRDLREAKRLLSLRHSPDTDPPQKRATRIAPPQDEFSPGLAPDDSQKPRRPPNFEPDEPTPPNKTSLKPVR